MSYYLKLGNQQIRTVLPPPVITEDWVRPADWIAMPTVTQSQEFNGIVAVYPQDSNFIALSATTTAGSYNVDWGDGTSRSYASTTTAEYSHSYNSLPESSYCSRGYRQALITVTPSGSANLTEINLQKKHSRAGLPSSPSANWLDIQLSGPNITSSYIGFTTNITLYLLERARINSLSSSYTNFSTMFAYCNSLQSVSLNTQYGTDFSQMFRNCPNLRNIPPLNTSNGTNFSTMFSSCNSLRSIPLLNTSNGTNFSSMFSSCNSLQSVPILNISNGNNFSNMFSACNSLQSVTLLSVASSGSNYNSMFANCNSLQNISGLNTSSGSLFSQMFSTCYSLSSLSGLNVSNGSNFSFMFTNCKGLKDGALSGSRYTIDYTGCLLSRDAIVSIFNNLGTAIISGSTSITCSSNHGVVDLTAGDIAIANTKGWNVKTT